jgi:hypothetical protein
MPVPHHCLIVGFDCGMGILPVPMLGLWDGHLARPNAWIVERASCPFQLLDCGIGILPVQKLDKNLFCNSYIKILNDFLCTILLIDFKILNYIRGFNNDL